MPNPWIARRPIAVAAPISGADRAYGSGSREHLAQDVWSGFLPVVPGAQIMQPYEVVVDGAPGNVVDSASVNVAGDVAADTFFSVGDQETLQVAQGGLEALVGSLAFLGGGAPAGSMGTPAGPVVAQVEGASSPATCSSTGPRTRSGRASSATC